ncbi:HTTM domain-containing protein [Streptomyces sp. NPDC047108]|uniref:HTTM domain-containing protein n=1 Tax=Streptomyces sp. NPDC047108 TaxID=3155025 RepID=UPI0033DFEA4E
MRIAPDSPVRRAERRLARGIAQVTGAALGPYQTAVIRIGFSFTWLFFLIREWPHRHEMYGPDGPWSWTLARQMISGNDAFTALMWSDGTVWFEFVYLFAVAASALLLLGWRTRTMSVLFMVGVLSVQNRSIFMGDGGDNVIHLMAIYLVLTRCGQVWSLDARRERRRRADEDAPGPESAPGPDATGIVLWSLTGLALSGITVLDLVSWGWALIFWGLWFVHALWWTVRRYAPDGSPALREARTVLDVIANLAHNGALLVIIAEVCLIYATAGWYKIQGSRWQDGTAAYYPVNLDYFSPWPVISDLMSSSGVLVMVITYGTVIVQVAFPFTLMKRRVKNVLLAVMMLEHAAFAVALGLPFFSLAMITADAVFLPTGFLLLLGGWAGRLRGMRPFVRERAPVGGDTAAPDRTLVG